MCELAQPTLTAIIGEPAVSARTRRRRRFLRPTVAAFRALVAAFRSSSSFLLPNTAQPPPNPDFLSIPCVNLSLPSPSHSRGLFRMPPPLLVNRYFIVHSGESTFETAGVIRTNPVSKTSIDSGLSADGLKQTARRLPGQLLDLAFDHSDIVPSCSDNRLCQ